MAQTGRVAAEATDGVTGSAVAGPPVGTAVTSTNGPGRLRGGATFVLVALVAVAAAGFARLFRAAIGWGVTALGGRSDPVAAADALPRWQVAPVVAVGVLTAVAIGRWANRRYRSRLGVAAVAAAARGENAGPSLAGSLTRALATLAASVSLAPIGRESAIIETGGSLGAAVARRTRRPVAPLAATGIAAAFSAAYHAPLAAVLYTHGHLGAGRPREQHSGAGRPREQHSGAGRPREQHSGAGGPREQHLSVVGYAGAGAGAGFGAARVLFGSGGPIFPPGHGVLSPATVVLALVALLPAYAASRLFFLVREHLVARSARSAAAPTRARRWAGPVVLAAAAGLAVALVPATAGNGMEAITASAAGPTVALAVGLLAGKLVATTCAIGSGAPGGIVSPSLAVAAGAALTTYHALAELGLTLPGSWWDGALVTMAVGLAVSVRSPLVAVVMVAEMTGDIRLVPLSAGAVAACYLLDAGVARLQAAPLPLLAGSARRLVLDDDA